MKNQSVRGPLICCLVLFAAILFLGFASFENAWGASRVWTQRIQFPDKPASVTYRLWQNYALTTTTRDSASITSALVIDSFIVSDNVPVWMDVVFRYPLASHEGSYREWFGNNWVATGDSVNYPIYYWFSDSLTLFSRYVYINGALKSSYVTTATTWKDSGQGVNFPASGTTLRVPDTSQVELVYTLAYGSDTVGFTERIPTQSPLTSSETDTVVDTLYFPDPPSSANLCRIYGWVGNAQQQTVGDVTLTFSLTENVVNVCDSAVMISTSFSTETNGSGYFYIDLIKSKCLQTMNAQGTATGRAKYNVSLDFGGQVKQLRPFTVPDSATCRLWW